MKTILTIFFLYIVLGINAQNINLTEYEKEIAKTNYQKGNNLVEALPIFGIILSSKISLRGNGFAFGHVFKYGKFIHNKFAFLIESEQNYYYYKNDKEEVLKESHTTSSTIDFGFRYYILNKRFTPFLQVGLSNIFNYDDWEDFDGLTPKPYYVGAINGGIGLSVPLLTKYNLNFGYRYFYPLWYTKDADLYNRFIFTEGGHFFGGISYIFNKNKKALKEKYSIE